MHGSGWDGDGRWKDGGGEVVLWGGGEGGRVDVKGLERLNDINADLVPC